MQPFEIALVPCLADNYCVLIHSPGTGETAAIDAPEAGAVRTALADRGWRLTHIFTTHHHGDHTGGNQALKAHFGCSITGPESEADRIPGLTRTVTAATPLQFSGQDITVLDTPGHTLGHVTYVWPQLKTAFTGDTLFSLGCGRIFEGDAAMMWSSLQKIAALGDETIIYCGHEYTLANGRFALVIEPENDDLKTRMAEVERLRAAGLPAVPTTIGTEKRTNPFLRPQSQHIRARLGMRGAPDWQVFGQLRQLRNKA